MADSRHFDPMVSLSCPFCAVTSRVALSVGTRGCRCQECGKTFWVTLAAPLVATTPPKSESAGTFVDLAGVNEATHTGLAAVPDAPTEAISRPPPHRSAPKGPLPKPTSPNSVVRRSSPARPKPTVEAVALGSVESARPGLFLGGLELLARIGAGGMGTVWLARQHSLDRNVAVKVLRPHLGEDPVFVMQFIREALAAAQLVHHHIAQIYDIGLEHQLHFFSMEYVDGESLSTLVRREGRLDPEVAAGYVLQAARGLKFAHERGIIHLDIKPDNLLLNRDGVVKVADLGLVRLLEGRAASVALESRLSIAQAEESATKHLMGTPAYMAPEQSAEDRPLDARTDVYSLGCTLYHLLTGAPPFEGETTAQTLSLHLFEPPVPPEQKAHRVPPALSELTLSMMAKRPEDRPQDMGEVITSLEKYLGIDGAGAFTPREEHAALLEQAVDAFNAAKWARRQRYARVIFLALVMAVMGGSLALGFRTFAAWAATFIATAVLTSGLINGVLQRSTLLLKLRHWALGAPWWAWAVGLSLVSGSLGVVAWFGQLRPLLELMGLAAGTGLSSYLLVDRRVTRERRPQLAAVEVMLKHMRLRGLEEQKLRQFVCRYSGVHWEAFYESLFGYEAKLEARARWGRDDKGHPRKRSGAWRDPLIRFVDRRLAARRTRQQARRLAKAERDARGQGALRS